MNKLSLYLMALLYLSAGILHFVIPAFYLKIMPTWMPAQLFLIYLSGVCEILLGGALLFPHTRRMAAWGIIAMLVVFFFAIHIPQTMDYYQTHNSNLIFTLIRLPIQFVLVYWAWGFAKKEERRIRE
jgi:uncharacterized membrane protein